MKIIQKKNNYIYIILLLLFSSPAHSDEGNTISVDEHEFNFYSGKFDFSDEGKRSTIVGFQHQNEFLSRNTSVGTISPVSGALMTFDNAGYIYTGVQAQYSIGKINFTPSFTPGVYFEGDGKDLGHPLEFKTELQLSFDFFKNSELGLSYNHISNASLGEKNPGANSYMFNFLKKF